MPARKRWETFGRRVWRGRETGHNKVGRETGHNARFQLSDGVPCRADHMLPRWFLKTVGV
jgi:hypothetical protein